MRANNARLGCLARKKIGQLQVTCNPGVRLHVQKTTRSAYLRGLGCFLDFFAVGLLPICLYKNNHRKAASLPFLFYRWLSRSPLIHLKTSVTSIESSLYHLTLSHFATPRSATAFWASA